MTLSQTQRAVAAILRADPAFAGIEVVAADAGDVFADAARALAGGCGLAVVVDTPQWRPRAKSSRIPLGDATVAVTVAERPAVSRAAAEPRETGLRLAERAACALNLAAVDPASGQVLALDDAGIQSAFDAETATATHTVALSTVCTLS